MAIRAKRFVGGGAPKPAPSFLTSHAASPSIAALATASAQAQIELAPLSAQERVRPTSTDVVACGGTFAKDSDHPILAPAFDLRNVTFTDIEADDGSKVPASLLVAIFI